MKTMLLTKISATLAYEREPLDAYEDLARFDQTFYS